jgi:DNA-binding SARP family transcriptional activator
VAASCDSDMRRILSFIIFVILSAFHTHAQKNDLNYGLAFASHEVSKDHRTMLSLNPDKPYSFNKDISLEFDLAFQRLTNAYGYILRVIVNDSLNIDLMSTPEHEEFHDLTLVINNKPTQIEFDFSDVELQALQWTTVRISFSFKQNQISLSWNGKTKTQKFSLSGQKNFRFYYGANEFEKFSTTDAPPIVIRNIELSEGTLLLHKWLLQNHGINEVYDSIENEAAIVKNPIWLIDRHTKWTHRKSFTTKRFPSVAFNSDSAILYLTDENSLYTYDLNNEELASKKVKKGNPVYSDANQLLYISKQKQIINYDLFSNKLQAFDFNTLSWPNTDTTYNEPNYWHNNKFFNPFDNSVYTFGGYGHFTYHNTFYRYDQLNRKWMGVKTSGTIPPRYLAASGLRESTNQVLIFGGYGSMSGKQELSPQSFYDLYSFDLKNHSILKIRDYEPPQESEDIVFSNSLIVNEYEHCFYVLSFPKNKYEGLIKLRQYSLDNADSKILADSLPFHFHDEDSFCDLFYSAASKELIVVTVHQEKKHYKVEVHSINYPPLQVENVLQSQKSSTPKVAYIGVVVLVGLCGVAIYLYKRRSQKSPGTSNITERNPINVLPSPFSGGTIVQVDDHKPTSSILFFGGFQIFDKTGVDISAKFTMTLKELFALIVLHSVKFEKGVSTTIIQEFLWPDKDEVSARNNRNVNIKKLRTLLDEVGGITIENNNSYLKLTMDDHIVCDYQSVYKLLDQNKIFTLSEQDKISIVIKYVKRGSLLPNLQGSWLDNFKSDVSNQIIDTLIEYAQKLDGEKDDKLLLEIADAVFAYDSINQEALVIKCSVLNKKGKYSLAKTWYDHFVKEYKNLYAENYPRTFEEVIS